MKNARGMVGAWLAIGIGVGIALGIALDNIMIGMAVGVAVGLAIGFAAMGRHMRDGGRVSAGEIETGGERERR